MYKRLKPEQLNDYFTELSGRRETGVYFCRINDYTPEVKGFLLRYLTEARRTGIVITGKIPNPDEDQLSYYDEMMGRSFAMNQEFLRRSLSKWMPAMDERQRERVASSIYNTLQKMAAEGKNENILKNAYIKFMCWLYYKFARIISQLGMNHLPKVIYQGAITNYELRMLGIVADAGCDILLVQPDGDGPYRQADPESKASFSWEASDRTPFPEGFSLLSLAKEAEAKERLGRLFDENAVKVCSTNTWLTGDILADAQKAPGQRGENPSFIYNMFCRLTGTEEKAAYSGQLFRWKADLEASGRTVYVAEELPVPTPDEIAKVNRLNYDTLDRLLTDMIPLVKCRHRTVEQQAKKSLIDLLSEEAEHSGGNLNRVKNRAVYLICWFNRYEKELFKNYREDTLGVYVFFGICRNQMEASFLRFLAKLPLDVILLNPDLTKSCVLEDPILFERKEQQSLALEKFPVHAGDISYGTVAYHAEQDLTEMMYQDSGIYRNKQYEKAEAITLQTMYEEISILWDQEVRFRPNFETLEDRVVVPVIAAKVSGVKDGNQAAYWQDVKKLKAEDTIVIDRLPHILPNSIVDGQYAPQFLKNRKLLRSKMKDHHSYKYGIFRQETQEHILDKTQELIDSGLIAGTFSRGMEFKIITVALNLSKEITRLIQKIDFTKKMPKLLCICTGEEQCSLEDAILFALLHYIGFDIVLFVPTGYRIVEQYYTQPLLVEHQIGEYIYDMQIPHLESVSDSAPHRGLMDRIFKGR